jgi:hypothetical protein
VEIKIGIKNIGRELSIEATETTKEITDAVAKAVAEPQGVLVLTDERGRKLLIPGAGIGYLEIGEEHHRRVGFNITE